MERGVRPKLAPVMRMIEVASCEVLENWKLPLIPGTKPQPSAVSGGRRGGEETARQAPPSVIRHVIQPFVVLLLLGLLAVLKTRRA